MALTIRAVRPGEASLVLGFIRELAEYEKLAHVVAATESMIDVALFAHDATTYCEIAEWDGEAVGFALWFLNFSTFLGRKGLYLEDLYVRPSHRSFGIGSALMRHLARKCVEAGWSRLEWAVLDWNTPAIAFYEAQGAVLRHDWRICRLTGDALTQLAALA